MTENTESLIIELVVISTKTTSDIYIESTNTVDKNKRNGYKIILAEFNECYHESKQSTIVQQINEIIPDLRKLISINLSYCNLKSLPDDMHLLRLKKLDVSNNHIGNIPNCIFIGLDGLEELNFSSNKIEIFDRAPKFVNTLKVLNLSKNKLQNPPLWFLNVKSSCLEEINYNYNAITSLKAHKYVYTIKYNLKQIEFINSSVRQEDIGFFKEIRTLKYLNLSNTSGESTNAITDFDYLFDEPKWSFIISTVVLNYVGISILPEGIGKLRYLKELHVENNVLSWLSSSLTKLQHLRILNISHNNISFLPQDFNDLHTLEMLNASYNCLSSINLINMPDLKYVDLYSNDIECLQIDETVEFVDVENNHINHVDIFINNYETKKEALRSKLINHNRTNGEKEEYETDTYSSCSSSMSNDTDGCVHVFNFLDEDENWDHEETLINKYKNVTLSDEEYDGEDININVTMDTKKLEVISTDENCIFTDAE